MRVTPPLNSARSWTWCASTNCQSGEVSPSPPPLIGWLLVMFVMLQFTPAQLSLDEELIVTLRIVWLGGDSEAGLAESPLMVGGVGSTVVVAVFELLPGTSSTTSLEAVAELLIMVPPVVPALTLTTTVKLAVDAPAADGFLNISVPVPPAATESIRLHPAGRVAETNVVLAGIGSLTVALVAAADELFLKPIV